MRIDHIASYVHNLEATKAFYEKYFEAIANNQYHNPKTGLQSYFLTFENGCRYEIMSKPDLHETDNSNELFGYIHIAFSVGDVERVNRLTERLRMDGYAILSEPRTTGDGYYESCVADPEGNRIEIVV